MVQYYPPSTDAEWPREVMGFSRDTQLTCGRAGLRAQNAPASDLERFPSMTAGMCHALAKT